MVELKKIKKMYRIGNSELWALNGVNITIEKGDFAAFQGPSGSGKSTLLNIVGLLDTSTEGEYFIDNRNVSILNLRERSAYRAKYLGFVFQSFNLIPELNVFENIEIPLLIARTRQKVRKDLVMEIINEVGLEKHIKHRPGELSGGQQQRVAIARALVKKPPLIIADEPTANLDTKTGTGILKLMQELNEKHKITFLFATHDNLVVQFMKRVFILEDGLIKSERKL